MNETQLKHSPYTAPESKLVADFPDDDNPLPWEDPIGYPTLRLRLFKTITAFFRRPAWFFGRIAKGPESIAKPFAFWMLIWSPVFTLTALVGVAGLIASYQNSTGTEGVVYESYRIKGLILGLLVLFSPIWFFSLLVAWGLPLHGWLKLFRYPSVKPLSHTLRSMAYAATLLFPIFIALGIAVLMDKIYFFLSLSLPFILLLTPGLAVLHGSSKWKMFLALIGSLGGVSLLTEILYTHLVTRVVEAVSELKGWTL